MNRVRRIFVDHGEAYGNLGDEAMLTNALRRLTAHLGECVFVIPREGTRPLPHLPDYRVEQVASPYLYYLAVGQLVSRARNGLRRLRLPVDPTPPLAQINAVATRLAKLQERGIGGTLCGDLQPLRKVLAECDAFYGVGAADFNDFNAMGSAYKAWLYEFVRPYVPVSAVSAQGFGPLHRADLRPLMTRAFNNIDLLGFRDHAFSADYTRSLGPLSCRSKVIADEALTLPVADAGARDAFLAQAGLAPGEEFIAVHWRHTDYTQETAKFYGTVASAFDAAVRETGLKLVFFPMSYDVHSGHDDECCAAVREAMAHPDHLLMAPVVKDPGLIKAGIGAARFTLGLSYHVHVFALSQGKPAIILFSGDYYHYKSHGLVDFYGSPCAALDVSQVPTEAVHDAVRRVNAQRLEAGRHIQAVNAELMAVNDWTMAEMARLLRERGR